MKKDVTSFFEENIKLNQAIRFVEERESKPQPGMPVVRLAFLRNITLDNVATFTKYYALDEGFMPVVRMGEFGGYMQEVLDGNSFLYTEAADIIIISLHPEAFSERLCGAFCGLGPDDAGQEAARFIDTVGQMIAQVRGRSDAVIIVHNWPIPTAPAFGILDSQSGAGQLALFRKANERLRELAASNPGVYVLDIDMLQSRLGENRFIDRRFWHYAGAPYSLEAARIIGHEHLKFVRALKGRNSKCLVLDCDNTLWGGIVGEDGVAGLKLGESYPGSCYQDLQRAAVGLYQRGVMLALCSKNNDEDVVEVFDAHPGMILRMDHLVARRVNWQDKVANLESIAAELNIGLDSLVFVDDNEFEIALIREMLPMVRTIHLPKNYPEIYAELVRRCGFFDSLTFSEEDRRRSEMYKAEAGRKQAAQKFATRSLDDYYRHLQMRVQICPAESLSIPRLAQLSQRTNQFNLTTKRYSEAEIMALSQGENTLVRSLSLQDQFGDLGIVGEIILRKDGDVCCIDTFLLSCRVIGRGVERVLLKYCEETAKKWGCVNLRGVYIPTLKNRQVEMFYPDNGFVREGKEGGQVSYLRSLTEELSMPDFFAEIDAPVVI